MSEAQKETSLRTRVMVIGHSHMRALEQASRSPTSVANDTAGPEFRFQSIDQKEVWTSPLIVPQTNGGTRVNPALGLRLKQEGMFDTSRPRAFVSAMAGNFHNVLGLLQQDEPFDVIIPGYHDLHPAPGARILPIAQVGAYLREKYQPFFDFFARVLTEASPATGYWVEPPPPIEDNVHIRENIDLYFRNNYPESRLKINAPQLRRKMWLINRIVLQDVAREQGWHLLQSPQTTHNAQGFLDKPAWAGDATHASAWYGEETLKQLVEDIGNHEQDQSADG